MNFFKQSALAFSAWHLSSVITVFQMGFFKVTMPETYNWIIGMSSAVAVPAWQMTKEVAGVVWEFLNTS